jgi:hypothetical protein
MLTRAEKLKDRKEKDLECEKIPQLEFNRWVVKPVSISLNQTYRKMISSIIYTWTKKKVRNDSLDFFLLNTLARIMNINI